MLRILIRILFFIIVLSTNDLQACGIGPVLSPWSLNHNSFNGDQPGGDELPYLSPGNDTRTNLQLLMLDISSWKFSENKSYLIHKNTAEGYDYDGKKEINFFSPAIFTKEDLDKALCKDPQNNINIDINDADYDPYKEASRCDSSTKGAEQFEKAVNDEINISKREKSILINQRKNLVYDCQNVNQALVDKNLFISEINKPSKLVSDFATYIAGAKSFYDGNFDNAIDQFLSIINSENKWLSETSQYMIGRVYLNKSQVGAFDEIDGVPVPKISSMGSIFLSKYAFMKYIQNYPSGIYFKSANGLMRRLAWLSQDFNSLSDEYVSLIEHIGDKENTQESSDIANEIDMKYFRQEDPLLNNSYFIAIDSLKSMRTYDDVRPQYSERDLEKDEIYFKKNKALYLYLLAARAYYVDKNLQKAKTYLFSKEFNLNSGKIVNFSRNMLLGEIYIASGNYKEAEKHLLSIMPTANLPWMKEGVELGLAICWERLGLIDKAFNKETRLESPRLRAIIIQYIAGPTILREVIENPLSMSEEKTLAYYILLFKEATRGQYKDFIKDINAYKPKITLEKSMDDFKTSDFDWGGSKEEYQCLSMQGTIQELSNNQGSSHALLCLSDFIRIHELDGFETTMPKRNELGGAKSFFPGQIFSRGEIYKQLISDNTVPETDKSYALYRAIMCYSPANLNGCGGRDVNISQRKKWFDVLKSKYGHTSWAKDLHYYW